MLEVTNAHKTFFPGTPNAVHALRGVDLKIERGSWVCVIGTNGSGKSTLLNAVAGGFLLDEGSIRIDGVDVSKVPPNKRDVNTVFQQYALFPHMNVFDNVAFVPQSKNVDKATIKKRVTEML